jgi:CheY-like chemotaxis protein
MKMGWDGAERGVREHVRPRRVLVVEDEVIVGMLLEDMLGELGCEVAAISTHLEQALQLARTLDIDLAILDVNLRGTQSFPVADVLSVRSVPFLFATGYGAQILKPPYSGTPTLQKPFQLDDLRQILALSCFQAGN